MGLRRGLPEGGPGPFPDPAPGFGFAEYVFTAMPMKRR